MHIMNGLFQLVDIVSTKTKQIWLYEYLTLKCLVHAGALKLSL
jgi:hypothetical protein